MYFIQGKVAKSNMIHSDVTPDCTELIVRSLIVSTDCTGLIVLSLIVSTDCTELIV